MSTKETSIQVKRSRAWIFTALMQLMGKKPFHRISVTDITNKAGVSRITFYRNYISKEDIFVKKLDELFDEFYLRIQRFKASSRFLYEMGRLAFEYWGEHAYIVEKMVEAGVATLILTRFTEYLQILHKDLGIDEDYLTHYSAGGLYATLLEWIKRGQDRSAQSMALMLENVFDFDQILKDNQMTEDKGSEP